MYNPYDSSTPYDDENGLCQICGREIDGSPLDRCGCPVCDECGEVGDPDCVQNHGLVVNTKPLIVIGITPRLLTKELARQEGKDTTTFWQSKLNVMDVLTVEAMIGFDPPVYAAFNMWQKSIQQVAAEILVKHKKITSEQEQAFENLCHAQDCMYESPAMFRAWRG